MSNRRHSAGAIVSRNYTDEPDHCARAVELLLKQEDGTGNEKAGVATDDDYTEGEFRNGSKPRSRHN
jgi:hypothetical protein